MKKNIILFASIIKVFVGLSQFSTNCETYLTYAGEATCNTNPYILVFEDNFNGNSLNFDKWQIQPWGQGALLGYPNQEYNTLENVDVSDGTCKISIKKESVYRKAVNWRADNEILEDGLPNLREYQFTASNLWSKYKFEFGKFEIRCKIPKGKGLWPAFWLFGSPENQEIDVFEFTNEKNYLGEFAPSLLSKVHCMNIHRDYDHDGSTNKCPENYTGIDFSQDFHIFTLKWTPFKIEWLVDGVLVNTVYAYTNLSGQNVDCNGIQPSVPFNRKKSFPFNPMNIIFSCGVQSAENSPNQSDVFPKFFEVDYIRYYKQIDCNQDLIITNNNTNLNSEIYNVFVGNNVTIGNDFTLGSGQQLTLIASTSITIDPNFNSSVNSNFETLIKPDVCIGSQKSQSYESIETLNFKKNDDITLFPNPTSKEIIIDFKDLDIIQYSFSIFDEKGLLIKQKTDISDQNKDINIDNFTAGIYFINLTVQTKTGLSKEYSFKFIKD